MLAHVGAENGMFLYNGEVSLFLSYYPALKKNADCELFAEVPLGYYPESSVVPLVECASLRWLWRPVKQEANGDVDTSWFFVRY